MLSLYVGYASGNTNDVGGRIRAVTKLDRDSRFADIPLAFPLMPKIMHVKPKDGEAVIVFISNDEQPNSQRYYIGPVISQFQNFFYDDFASFSATKLLGGGLLPSLPPIENNPLSQGLFPKDDEVSLIGRKNAEIIIGDNDIRLRAGVRVTDPVKETVTLNGKTESMSSNIRVAPAFIKIVNYETPIKTAAKKNEINPHTDTKSCVTIVGDKINLISPNRGGINLTGEGESISEDKMKEIIEKAHQLPYGDLLCEFLSEFLKVFRSHVHAYHALPPVDGPTAQAFWEKYSTNKNVLEDKLLSKDIRIN